MLKKLASKGLRRNFTNNQIFNKKIIRANVAIKLLEVNNINHFLNSRC